MAVTAFWFGKAFLAAFNKEIDLPTDAINALLSTSTTAPDQDVWDYYDDVTNEVAAGGGYTTGGELITTDSSTYTGGTNIWNYDGDDVTWATSTITARYAIVYDTTPGTAATDPLMSYVNFGTDQSSSGGDFKIVWNAAGIVRVTVS